MSDVRFRSGLMSPAVECNTDSYIMFAVNLASLMHDPGHACQGSVLILRGHILPTFIIAIASGVTSVIP